MTITTDARPTETAMLDIRGLTKRYGSAYALNSIDLRIRAGEFLTLLGPSGSGKTTLLRLIVGFDTPTGGVILLEGEDVSVLTPGERGIGMVFQQYALFPHMSVADNIGYGLKLRRWSKTRRKAKISEMLGLMRLEPFADRAVTQLSGGQQQRVALARALAYDPAILLMDEPLGALDKVLRLQMEEEIRRIHRELGTTFIYVTHDQQEALALSDRIAIMRHGDVVALGTPEDLFYRPGTAFVAEFFANSNVLTPDEMVRVDGGTQVRWGDQRFAVEGTLTGEGPAGLAVRRRSLRLASEDQSLTLRGTVAETLLLGDEREVVIDVVGAGRIVALIDARGSAGIEVGQLLELHAPTRELSPVILDIT